MTDDGFFREMSGHHQAQVGGVKLDLPVDEDDYLMPSPQLSITKTQYMDLIGDATAANGKSTLIIFSYINRT